MEKLDENLMTTTYSIVMLLKSAGIRVPNIQDIMRALDTIKDSGDINKFVSSLLRNEEDKDIGDSLFNIIYDNTVKEKESLDYWTKLALS